MAKGNRTVHPKRSWESYPPPVLDEATGCLRWQGPHMSKQNGKGRGGYGRIGARYAHRVAWERVHGPIAAGMEIDHVYERGCRYTDCVNVDHLEEVTPRENMRRWAISNKKGV